MRSTLIACLLALPAAAALLRSDLSRRPAVERRRIRLNGADTDPPPSPPPTRRCVSSSWVADHSVGDFLIQRAIQTQLHYSADLRNEPAVGWLARFRDHAHLDGRRAIGVAGLPHTYAARLDGLNLATSPLGWKDYLDALATSPNEILEVR